MKIAAYCRVSTGKEEQLDSLAHQKEFFLAYAKKQGHELVGLYADEGISGTGLKKREQFVRLMADAEEGLFQTVVVKDVSRFARNTVDFLQSIRRLKALGVTVQFLNANMDSLGESEFVLTVFSALAQEESAGLSRRVKFGKKLNARKGRVPQRVFGYDRLDNFTLVVNGREAAVVREIYRLYLEEGLGCRRICQALNDAGHFTKSGCRWEAKSVRRVLTNSLYCGEYVNNKYETVDYLTGRQIRLPEEEHFRHHRPEWAIVSPEDFARVQAQMAQRRSRHAETGPPARYSGKYLFSTLIRCECCGRAFCRKTYTYAHTRVYWKCSTNDRYTARACGNTVKLEEEDLRAAIAAYLRSRIPDWEGFMRGAIEEAETKRAVRWEPPAARDAEGERRRLGDKRRRFQEMYANGILTMAELKERTAELEAQWKVLERETRTGDGEDRARREAEYRQSLARLPETLDNGELRVLIDYIAVTPEGQVRVIFR